MTSKNYMKFTFSCIRISWNTATLFMHSLWLLSLHKSLDSCDRDLRTFEKIFYLAFYRKKFADFCPRDWRILLSYLVTALFFVSALSQELTP